MTTTQDTAAQDAIDLADPRWFPVDLDPVTPRFAMLRIDEGHVTGPAFMDNRLGVDFAAARPVPLQAMPALPAPSRSMPAMNSSPHSAVSPTVPQPLRATFVDSIITTPAPPTA